MIRVAVVGTGSAGTRHITNLLALGHDVIAVSEHRKQPEVRIGDVDVPAVTSYLDVLGDVEAVVIANPTSLHLDYASAAIAAGCHVLCEKPFATSAAGVQDLADIAREAGLVAAVACQFRFNGALNTVKDRIDQGVIGRLLDVDANQGENLTDYHPDEDYRDSYAARSDLGGGVLLTQIHQLDFLYWLFGPFTRVFASGGRRSDLDIDVEDSVSYVLETEDGAAVRGHLDYTQRPRRQDMVAVGTEGRISWDYYANEVVEQPVTPGAEPIVEQAAFDRNPMFVDLVADFVTSIGDETTPRATASDAAAVLAIVDAIKTSMTEHCAIELAPRPE